MKIENSNIAMASTHSSYSYSYLESASVNARADSGTYGAILELSQEGEISYKESLSLLEKQTEESRKKQEAENWQNTFDQYRKQQEDMRAKNNGKTQFDVNDEYDLKIKMLRKMLELLNGGKLDKNSIRMIDKEGILDLRTNASASCEFNLNVSSSAEISVGTNSRRTMWQKISVESGFHSEYENTTFASKGLVQTADGRSIDFNVELTMGRSFSQEINSISAETYFVTDPLIINTDKNITEVTDQKFMFDIDSDGKEESISFAAEGSGFLALDKNGDGKINDGSELFGTKSGNGFADLAEYDSDKNGWIDENDDVFSKLKVWSKDKDGNDILMSLKDADVGAIFLGSADTEFTQKNDKNEADAIIRKTGIFLKESTGQAGTIAHVDLVLQMIQGGITYECK